MDSQILAQFGSTILGGLIAAITGYCTQRSANRLTQSKESRKERSARRAGAIRAIFLLGERLAEASDLRKQINLSIERARAQNPNLTELWSLVVPIAGIKARQRDVSLDDVTFLVDMKEYDYLAKVFDLERRCEIAVSSFQEYMGIRRSALYGMPATSNGPVLLAEVDQLTVKKFEQSQVAMNTLLSELIDTLESTSVDGPALLIGLSEKANIFFKEEGIPSVRVEERP